jgi:hypothetical protein
MGRPESLHDNFNIRLAHTERAVHAPENPMRARHVIRRDKPFSLHFNSGEFQHLAKSATHFG